MQVTSGLAHQISDSHRLGLLIEALTDHALYMLDQDGFVASWNSGAERINGYRSAEIVGKHFSRFFSAEDRSKRIPERILAEARALGRYEAEGWRVRKDGTRFWANVIVTPVRDDQGGLIGFAKITRDITERMRADVELRDREARMRAIVNTVLDGIITIDDKGTIENFNPAAARAFGYSPEEAIGHNVKMLMAEPFRTQHDSYLKNYLDTGQGKAIGTRRELTAVRKDGSTFPMELAVSEIIVAGRRMFVGVVHDITRRRWNAERRAILMAELDHRVKNVLARVAMLTTSTRKGSTSIDEYVRSINGRIQAMADAHSLLSQSGWQNVGLGALVQKQLAPYATGSNVTITGPDIMLGAAEIQAVAMVLHELVTNAAKYGSLSVPNGRVCVTWNRQDLDDGAKLVFEWRELGGPRVAVQASSGYGASLIRDLIPYELGGTVDLAFAPDGVNCKIEIALQYTPIASRGN
jgi:PAS domain S-box-containing protein